MKEKKYILLLIKKKLYITYIKNSYQIILTISFTHVFLKKI